MKTMEYASDLVKKQIWPDFTAHFKSEVTKESYASDLAEVMNYFQKDFLMLTVKDGKEYYEYLKNRVEAGEIKPGTMAKKIRELHSFAEYISDSKEKYELKDFTDIFAVYLPHIAKQEKVVSAVPIEHIDRLLQVAETNPMAYCIFILLYRAGLNSSEIVELRKSDFTKYENGVYVIVSGRQEACYIPEDAVVVLEKYMGEQEEKEYLFYNSRGNQLNTMFISRLMKKYTKQAGIPSYSAQALRNSCGVTLYAYGARDEQVAGQLGTTKMQIKRYRDLSYRESLQREANRLVNLQVKPPKF